MKDLGAVSASGNIAAGGAEADFNASRSSSTYKDDAPVQQDATVVCFCIRY